jgi:hypothetical protein
MMKQSDWWLVAVVCCLGVMAQLVDSLVAPSAGFFPVGPVTTLGQSKDGSENAASDVRVLDRQEQSKILTKKIVAYSNVENWTAILNLFQEEEHAFTEINYAAAMAKLAKIRSLKKQDTVFLQFLEAMEAKLPGPDEDPICYATVAHALAKLRLQHNDVTARVFHRLTNATVAERFVNKGYTQNIANTAWACAKLGHRCPELFAAIGKPTALKLLVENGKPQEIANTAWACAKLGHSCPELFAAIGTPIVSKRLVYNGNAQDIENTAWACAHLGHSCPVLFQEVRNGWEQRLGFHFSDRQIFCIVRSFKALGHIPPTRPVK